MEIINISIRKVGSNEVEFLQELGRRTFLETFGDSNTNEDMEDYLSESFDYHKLKAEVVHPLSDFYFAEVNGNVVGYLKLNLGEAQTESELQNACEIERIYVLSEYLGKKVGQQLFEKAVAIAKSTNVEWLWLGVWEHNQRAIRFYEKNGMEVFGQHVFKLGEDEQTDLLMRLALY
ncbi:GNAT family N-acetyltransferase [Limibacter armeniacum]|uniref:GNAT family N-acetyltransferase n=1 Tax=Limibacter armeniacum TaxID=466084 RepID=UPI002FE5F791